jgi:hypothetical protein
MNSNGGRQLHRHNDDDDGTVSRSPVNRFWPLPVLGVRATTKSVPGDGRASRLWDVDFLSSYLIKVSSFCLLSLRIVN